MKINARLIVFCLVTVFQAAVIFLLGAFGDYYVKTKLNVIGAEQLKETNVTLARQTEAIIDELRIDDLRIGTKGWLLAQRLIEKSRIQDRGLAYIVDTRTNLPICHPDFQDHPELAEQEMESWKQLAATGKMIEFKDNDSLKTGSAVIDGEDFWVAGQTFGAGTVAVVVEQRLDGIVPLVGDAAFPITKLLIGICVIGLFMSTVAGCFILWWTETKLTELQNEIDVLESKPVRSKAFINVEDEHESNDLASV